MKNWITYLIRRDGSTQTLRSTSRFNLNITRAKLLSNKNETLLYVSPIKPEGFEFHLPVSFKVKTKVKS